LGDVEGGLGVDVAGEDLDGAGVGVGGVQGDAGGGHDGGDAGAVELLGPGCGADDAAAEVGQPAGGDDLGDGTVGGVGPGVLPALGDVGDAAGEPGRRRPRQGGRDGDDGSDLQRRERVDGGVQGQVEGRGGCLGLGVGVIPAVVDGDPVDQTGQVDGDGLVGGQGDGMESDHGRVILPGVRHGARVGP